MAAELRRLGSNIEKASKTKYSSITDFARDVGLSVNDVSRLFEGRLFLPPFYLKKISQLIGLPFDELINTDGEYALVDCMGNFKDEKNKDKILDLIDNYIDLVEAVS